jgi:HAMP domain-containing protein
MKPNSEIVIGNAGADCVTIRPGSRYSVEGWLTAEVRVQCDGWRGGFNTDFMKGELNRLARELRRLRDTLKGEARLEPLERQLMLVFEGDGKGHIKVSGKAVNVRHSNTFLEFGMEIDQSYLERIIRGLEEADPAGQDRK